MILSTYTHFQKQFRTTNKLEQIAIKNKRGKMVIFDDGFNLKLPFLIKTSPIFREVHFFMLEAIFSTLN